MPIHASMAASSTNACVTEDRVGAKELGFVARESRSADRRVRAASITRKGRDVARILAAAREKLFRRILCDWTDAERRALSRLAVKLADRMKHLGMTELSR